MTDDQTTDEGATTAPHRVPDPPPPVSAPPPYAQPAPPQPAWQPPPADHGRSVSLVFGLILLVVGGWFFATRTLGLDLPRIDWGQFWPLILIAIGIWIVWRSMRRAR